MTVKKYRLIKEYPGSPELGTVCEPNGFGIIAPQFSIYEVEKYKEFWEEFLDYGFVVQSFWNSDSLIFCPEGFSDISLFLTGGKYENCSINSIKRAVDGKTINKCGLYSPKDNLSNMQEIKTFYIFGGRLRAKSNNFQIPVDDLVSIEDNPIFRLSNLSIDDIKSVFGNISLEKQSKLLEISENKTN